MNNVFECINLTTVRVINKIYTYPLPKKIKAEKCFLNSKKTKIISKELKNKSDKMIKISPELSGPSLVYTTKDPGAPGQSWSEPRLTPFFSGRPLASTTAYAWLTLRMTSLPRALSRPRSLTCLQEAVSRVPQVHSIPKRINSKSLERPASSFSCFLPSPSNPAIPTHSSPAHACGSSRTPLSASSPLPPSPGAVSAPPLISAQSLLELFTGLLYRHTPPAPEFSVCIQSDLLNCNFDYLSL